MTLTEFLLARYDEIQARFEHGCDGDGEYSDVVDLLDIVMADVEAKRRIVESLEWHQENAGRGSVGIGELLLAEQYAKYLALPYADHADYREEWKP